MSGVSLERGRKAEQLIARRLTRWSAERYVFRRRGLGHKGLPDLIVSGAALYEPPPYPPAWPYPISVKSWASRAPGLHGLCRMAGDVFRQWQAGGGDRFLAPPSTAWRWWTEIPAGERTRYWLVWRCHGTWWLSADTGNPVWNAGPFPAVLRLAGPGAQLPSWTAPFDHLLALDVVDVVRAAHQ